MIGINKFKHINEFYYYVKNKWISKGFPSNPSWGWNKASPKKSLYDIGMDHTANNLMLNLVASTTFLCSEKEFKTPISFSRLIIERLNIVIAVGSAISESCALSIISIFEVVIY